MATALRQPYQQYRQRTLITGIAAAIVLVIVIFLVHDFFDEFLESRFGLGDRSADTLITLFGLLL
ncbi:MAG: chemotaxis protein, partial [Candidatus Accumulibacter sp.]|nr:chemotaxis protein [Accumulibacter sp.]